MQQPAASSSGQQQWQATAPAAAPAAAKQTAAAAPATNQTSEAGAAAAPATAPAANPAAAAAAIILFSEEDCHNYTGPHITDAQAAQVMDILRQQLTTADPGGPPGWSAQYIDLSDGAQFNWKGYLTAQGQQTVQCGITAFGAGFIKHIKDPNHLGQDRFDFIAFYANLTVARFHPNRKTANSAKILYGTLDEWSINGSDAVPPGQRSAALIGGPLFTLQQALNPNLQQDKLGFREACLFAKSLQEQDPINRHPTNSQWEDLSSGMRFQWWRWISNLGRQGPDVIGKGITGFFYDYHRNQFVASRTDQTTVTITLTKPVTVKSCT